MTRLFGRVIRVEVEGPGGSATFFGDQHDEPGLQIGFTCTLSIGSKPNSGTVSITNLSEARRKMLGNEYTTLTLLAGYKDSGPEVIFRGQIRDSASGTKGSGKREKPDVITTIEVGDGDKAFSQGKASKTFKAGTKPKEIVEYLRKQMPGVSKGTIKGLDDLPATKRATVLYGKAYREMDTLGRKHGFYWSIQNGALQIVKSDDHLGGAVIISSETGLLGSPVVTDKGCTLSTLIIPGLKVGHLIDVRSNFLDTGKGNKRDKRGTDAGGGLFRIATMALSGNSRDDDFEAEIEAHRVQGDKVKK